MKGSTLRRLVRFITRLSADAQANFARVTNLFILISPMSQDFLNVFLRAGRHRGPCFLALHATD